MYNDKDNDNKIQLQQTTDDFKSEKFKWAFTFSSDKL